MTLAWSSRLFLRTMAILAAVKCIPTLLLISNNEESLAYLDNFDDYFEQTRQLSPIIDPKTVEESLSAAAPDDDDEDSERLTICNRPTNVPLAEPPSNLQKFSCTPITNSKPILLLSGSKGYGRTGNRIIEFLKTVQHSRDHGVQVGIQNGSWVMNEITRMWMAHAEWGGTDWAESFEKAFCVKIFWGHKDFNRGGWTKIQKTPRDLFRFTSRIPIPEYAQSQEYTIRTLFRDYNTGVGYATDGKPAQNMCSVIDALFPAASDNNEEGDDTGDTDPSSAVYSVIHSRSMGHEGGGGVTAGVTLLRGVSNHAGCDPIAALEMRPDYVKSILQPLGMLEHPIVFISDGQDPSVLERLLDDPELGPLIRVPPKDTSWIGGDITVGVMSNVFIGNPASTFATFIAKARLALGFKDNYLFRAKDKDGNWKTVCGDRCLFDHSVLNVMA